MSLINLNELRCNFPANTITIVTLEQGVKFVQS